MLERHAAGAAAEQGGPVGSAQTVIAMAEVDLELARAQLSGDDVGVNALLVGRLNHVAQYIGVP
ncbi:hypothetical protein D3C84_1219080 [compost metagenome]